MDARSSVSVQSKGNRDNQENSGLDLESLDEGLEISTRDVALANYRGVAPSLFFVAAAGFALVAATVASGIAVAVLCLEIGRANERTRDLEAVVATKADAFAQCNLKRIEAEAEVKTYSALLDRVAPGRPLGGAR